MKTVAIVQARMGSTRLPNKVMKLIEGEPLIALLLRRLEKATEIDQIVVATSFDSRDDVLAKQVQALGYVCFRGEENDVLDRYLQAARTAAADVVVRITGDCPLVDPALVDEAIRRFRESSADYFSNVDPPMYPDGLDIEVFTRAALELSAQQTDAQFDHQHVTPWLRRSPDVRRAAMLHSEDLSGLRWTVDEASDFEVVANVACPQFLIHSL